MKYIKKACGFIKTLAEKNIIVIASTICAFAFVIGGIFIGESGTGLQFTTATGTLVTFLTMVLFLYFCFLAVDLKKDIRIVMCTGLLLILVEYISSVVYNINLNRYTSITWNDIGMIFIIYSILRMFYLAKLKPLLGKKDV